MNTKKKNLLLITVFLIFTSLLNGCGNSSGGGGGSQSSAAGGKTDTPTVKIKTIRLGQSSDFSILAYATISSVPTSFVEGKVGLMPGTREQITMDPSEVAGGAADIIGSEDETVPINLLSNAKVDMVTAYMTATGLSADSDKSGIYNGVIDDKTLSPGVYDWSNNVTISKDFTVSGTPTDYFIFKIKGHLKVGKGVQMKLDGVKADNVLWQVSGATTLEPESHFSGTIIAQQSIEMKAKSTLTGRAFCKNGFVNLEKATIKKP